MNPQRRRVSTYGVLLLLYQMLGVVGINRIPPVTLSLVGLQVAIFLRLFKLPWHGLSGVCISVYNVYHKREYRRLIFSAIEHVDDWHLYYNMVSFIVKGQSLERRFGSLKFLYITTVFAVLTNVMYLILGILAGEIDKGYEMQCAVGFSGVLFALKVLTTHYDPNYSQRIMGMPIIIPARYAVWAELVLIQLLIPNVSFLGHLGGALVGLAYVMGPLRVVMDFVYSVITTILRPRVPFAHDQPRFEPRAESAGYHASAQFSEYIPPGMSEEEQLQQATEASLRDSFTQHQAPYPAPRPEASSNNMWNAPPAGLFANHRAPYPTPELEASSENVPIPPPPGLYPNLPEMRRKRLEHFNL